MLSDTEMSVRSDAIACQSACERAGDFFAKKLDLVPLAGIFAAAGEYFARIQRDFLILEYRTTPRL